MPGAKNDIFSRAKRLRKKHPRKFKTWTQYVKAASKQRRIGQGTHTPIKKVKGIRAKSKNRHRTLGKVSAHSLFQKGKRLLTEKIDNLVIRKYHAKKKTQKKKIQKQISTLTATVRKLPV